MAHWSGHKCQPLKISSNLPLAGSKAMSYPTAFVWKTARSKKKKKKLQLTLYLDLFVGKIWLSWPHLLFFILRTCPEYFRKISNNDGLQAHTTRGLIIWPKQDDVPYLSSDSKLETICLGVFRHSGLCRASWLPVRCGSWSNHGARLGAAVWHANATLPAVS